MVQRMNTSATFRQAVDRFITEWNDSSLTMTVHTSGSTGIPKAITVEKTRMAASARMTCDFLHLRAGQSALLCLPVEYIAGKMVIVRAIIRNLRLILSTPSSHPLAQLEETPDFAAFVPSQVYSMLDVPQEEKRLRAIGQILIGGGAIDADLQKHLDDFPHPVWSSYGMTETLSHIALRRLNGPEASDWYTPLPGVTLGHDTHHCLTVHAPEINPHLLVTNDIVDLRSNGRFRVIGRRDNTICSGGIKIQLEDVEARLRPFLTQEFIASSIPDKKYGEALVLLIEGTPLPQEQLKAICRKHLPPYHHPRHYFFVPQLPKTISGKPARKQAKELALSMWKNETNKSFSA